MRIQRSKYKQICLFQFSHFLGADVDTDWWWLPSNVQPHERKNPLGDECSNSAITDTQCSLIAQASIFPKIHMITQWTHSSSTFVWSEKIKHLKIPIMFTNLLERFQNSERTFLFPSTPRFFLIAVT